MTWSSKKKKLFYGILLTFATGKHARLNAKQCLFCTLLWKSNDDYINQARKVFFSKMAKFTKKREKFISNKPEPTKRRVCWEFIYLYMHSVQTEFINTSFTTNTHTHSHYTVLSCDEIAQKQFRMIYYRIECLRCLFSFYSFFCFFFFFLFVLFWKKNCVIFCHFNKYIHIKSGRPCICVCARFNFFCFAALYSSFLI